MLFWMMDPESTNDHNACHLDTGECDSKGYTDRLFATVSTARDTPEFRTAVSASFPGILYFILQSAVEQGISHIISWRPHGRGFIIRNVASFSAVVLGMYFKSSKYQSFQRQLNMYGFKRISNGIDAGAYYNEYFLRGRPELLVMLQRSKRVEGEGGRRKTGDVVEPDLYAMRYCITVNDLCSPCHEKRSHSLENDEQDIQGPLSASGEFFTCDGLFSGMLVDLEPRQFEVDGKLADYAIRDANGNFFVGTHSR